MRYAEVDTISFTDAGGATRPVKDLREIPTYETAQIVEHAAGEAPDELASRDDVFGAGREGDASQLWEANIVELADVGFDWARLRKVRIPR